jgi:FlaA1/EpsC-like NDP-sugar epimerase
LIEEGKPLTITDSKMTRFMLTLKESVELVLTALSEGVGGEVLVRKSPGHTITDLAEVMLKGLSKDPKNIVNSGIRPGEKINETLISPAESVRTVEFGDYYVILPQISIPAVEKKYTSKKTLKEFRYASDTTERMGKKDLKKILEKEGWI